MSKSFSQMRKSELVSYAHSVERPDIHEGMTKKEIMDLLAEDGLLEENVVVEPNNKNLPADSGDKVILKLSDKIKHFKSGKYVFTKDNKFVAVPKEEADRILQYNSHRVSVAMVDEIKRYFG